MASFTPLSVDEIGFFKEYGYLIKRNVLDLELCAQARDALWEGLRDDCPMKRWVTPDSMPQLCLMTDTRPIRLFHPNPPAANHVDVVVYQGMTLLRGLVQSQRTRSCCRTRKKGALRAHLTPRPASASAQSRPLARSLGPMMLTVSVPFHAPHALAAVAELSGRCRSGGVRTFMTASAGGAETLDLQTTCVS